MLSSEHCLRRNGTRCASYFTCFNDRSGLHDADLGGRLHLELSNSAYGSSSTSGSCKPTRTLRIFCGTQGHNRFVSIIAGWTVLLSSAAAVSSGLWRDARVQERIHGQLVAPPPSRCIRGPHRMRRSEPKSRVSHWRRKSSPFISHLFPSHTPIDALNTDHARRSHQLDDPPSDPFQIYDSTAFCVWTGDSLGGHHSSYTG